MPSRSMVLKVVTGKIFKTLGLSGQSISASRWSSGAISTLGPAPEVAPEVRLSRIEYYLIGNI